MESQPTALVTGASSGVGVHFARELAQRGYRLILSARRLDRLESVRRELEDQFSAAVSVVSGDLDTPGGAAALHAAVQHLAPPVSLLVNNAGWGKFGPLTGQSLPEIESMVQLNVTSLAILSRLFAADMMQRGGGRILNHASFSAIQPAPSYAVYSGTKAFVLAFSLALREEVRKQGVGVSALCPGFFQSDFFEHAGQVPSWIVRQLTMSPARVAAIGIRGALAGRAVIIPGWNYRLLNLVTRFLPRTVVTGIADFAVKH